MDQNYQSTPTESPGVYYPQDFSLQKLNFITSTGERIEMKRLLVDFSYYEDIYTFTSSGYLTVIDAQGFIELLQLTGNEFLEINFGKTKNGSNGNDQIFRVYKTGNRKPTGNQNSETYTFHFCSEELMLSEQTKVTKSYTGRKISDIVTDIMKDKLKTKANLYIDETDGMYDFVVPRMKPFEAISWVSTYAKPKQYSSSADMLFFETKEGFNFKSIQSMYKQTPYNSYKYEPKNLDDDVQNLQDKSTQVLEYEFSKTYDALHEISAGTFANKLISIDPITRSFNATDFDYAKKQMEKLNSSGVLSDLTNRLGNSANKSYEGVLKVVTGNANQGNLPYIKEKESGFAKDINVETFVPMRTAAISLANYSVLKMSIPGDPGITAGKTVEFKLFSLKPSNNKKELDKYYSGKYLVTAVRHIIKVNKYQTILELAKDSTNNAYSGANNSDNNVKQAVQS